MTEIPEWLVTHKATTKPPGFCCRDEWLVHGRTPESCRQLLEHGHALALCLACVRKARKGARS